MKPLRQFMTPVCKECGSERLLFDAYVKWDTEKQEYSIVNVFDQPTICEDCDGGETSVEWKEVLREQV